MSDGFARASARIRGAWQVFRVFLRLGLTSFGGPVAHLAFFRNEFVVRRRWIEERAYADLVALCQFLPGPASSQVAMALGFSRSGWAGALAAWTGFVLPSTAALILLALGPGAVGLPGGAVHGLQIAAVAVVAHSAWSMARTLCVGRSGVAAMVATACVALLLPGAASQIACIVLAALVGAARSTVGRNPSDALPTADPSARSGVAWLLVFALLLAGLPLLAVATRSHALEVASAFYRSGSLVFGGGHVVLPLLQGETVRTGWIDDATFLAGYGAAQAVPGPLFTFAAFLGASMRGSVSGLSGGLLCLVAIFLPSFLLVAGTLPFWTRLRSLARARGALALVNAAVVGLLVAALYDPLWTHAVRGSADCALVLVALAALAGWKTPPWLVVAGCALVASVVESMI